MIETNSVSPVAKRAKAGSVAGASCGLIARMTAAGRKSAGIDAGIRHDGGAPGEGRGGGGVGFHHHGARQAAFQPAGQHGAAHLAAADEEEVGKGLGHGATVGASTAGG